MIEILAHDGKDLGRLVLVLMNPRTSEFPEIGVGRFLGDGRVIAKKLEKTNALGAFLVDYILSCLSVLCVKHMADDISKETEQQSADE